MTYPTLVVPLCLQLLLYRVLADSLHLKVIPKRVLLLVGIFRRRCYVRSIFWFRVGLAHESGQMRRIHDEEAQCVVRT